MLGLPSVECCGCFQGTTIDACTAAHRARDTSVGQPSNAVVLRTVSVRSLIKTVWLALRALR